MADLVSRSSKLEALMESRGISRRSFLGYCAGIAAMIGLSEAAAPRVANALNDILFVGSEEAPHALPPVIWMEGSSCTGCTESFAQVDTPDPASVVLELISLNYCETLSAAAGKSMEEAREETIREHQGKYILVYEGSVVEGWNGDALRVGWQGDTRADVNSESYKKARGTEALLFTAKNAYAVVAFDSCACDGGWQAARPNPSKACGVQKFLKKNQVDTPVINIPCCPGNPEWIVAVLVEVLLMKRIPELNEKNEPKLMFDQTIHDNCPRRGHFENGEFVYQFGSVEEEKGYCLYALGCKGPQTFTNCPIVKWNRRVSFCIESGAPCAGCGVISPMNPGGNWVDENTPFLARHRFFSIGGAPIDPALIAGVVTGVVVAALVCHGIGMKLTGRTDGGADFETERAYDKKNKTPNAAEYAADADRLYDELDAKGIEERKANHRKGGDK